MGAIAAGMDDAFGDSFVVKVEELFAEMKVLKEYGPPGTDSQGVLVI